MKMKVNMMNDSVNESWLPILLESSNSQRAARYPDHFPPDTNGNQEKREEKRHRDTDPQISTHARKKRHHNKDFEAPTATRKDLEKESKVVISIINRRERSPVSIGIPGPRFNAMPTYSSSSIFLLRQKKCSANFLSFASQACYLCQFRLKGFDTWSIDNALW